MLRTISMTPTLRSRSISGKLLRLIGQSSHIARTRVAGTLGDTAGGGMALWPTNVSKPGPPPFLRVDSEFRPRATDRRPLLGRPCYDGPNRRRIDK